MTTSALDDPISSLSLDDPISSLSLDQNQSAFTIVNFAVQIPEELIALPDMNLEQNGVVGTITFLKNSAMVWVGWGALINADDEVSKCNANSSCGAPRMGNLAVAMPRSKYSGLSSGNQAPCSQMIGGDNEEEVMIGNNMASRLAKKTGLPIFVSCTLGEMSHIRSGAGASGMDESQGNFLGDMGSLAVHAAALAEKKIGNIIMEQQEGNQR